MSPHPARRRRLAPAAAALALLGVLAPVPAQAADGGDGDATALAIATALADASGPHAMVDDSGVTGCMGEDPRPVAYRTDRIVLRSSAAAGQIAGMVQAALVSVGGGGQVAQVEEIPLPPSPGGGALTPITVVHFELSQEPVPVVRLVRRLRVNGVAASPDYLLAMGSGPTAMWPGGPPAPATVPATGRAAGIGSGVDIAVYDTGLAPRTESVHPPNVTRLTQADLELPDLRPPFGQVDHYYGGHLVSIASTIDTVAPGASVTAVRITGQGGVATDSTAARRMAVTLRAAHQFDDWPELLVAAFGSAACDLGPAAPGGELVPLGLEAVTEAVDLHQRTVVVASAGNVSSSRHFYPAAFPYPSVVAVGALDTTVDDDGSAWTAASRTGPPASFSNYGNWVDSWAPGVGLTTLHLDGFRFVPDGPVVNGLAVVHGTSYAAPYLAALIAEEIAAAGVSPAAAWAAVSDAGRPCGDPAGGGVAVALTSLAGTATTPADPETSVRC